MYRCKKVENIPGYENFSGYFVNTKGEVYSNKGKGGSLKEIGYTNPGTQGYFRVSLSSVKERKNSCGVHVLVALAFIPNPEGKLEVDHLDRNRANNNVENLRWCSRLENAQNSSGKKPGNFIKVGVRNSKGEVFESVTSAAIFYGRNPKSISAAINGEQKTSAGLRWWRIED